MLVCLAPLSLQVLASDNSADNAFSLLNKMTRSLHQMSYKGVLVHVKNNDVVTLNVSHSIKDGEEIERVERQNKDGTPYSRKVSNYSLAKLPTFDKKMQAVYSFDLGNIKKVAARPCQLVIARPKDRMRYLQKFCVDTETSLLLEYTIIDKSHKPIEQFMFTNVELLQRDAPTKEGNVVAQIMADKAISISPAEVTKANNSTWSLKKTPKGFSLRKAPTMQGETIAEHYILSDGLSSVSIFISKKVPNSKQTGTHSGALNVVTYYKNNFAITLVGAVPKSTLKNIFSNLQYNAK
jgi:negative regulator of sigma E activity